MRRKRFHLVLVLRHSENIVTRIDQSYEAHAIFGQSVDLARVITVICVSCALDLWSTALHVQCSSSTLDQHDMFVVMRSSAEAIFSVELANTAQAEMKTASSEREELHVFLIKEEKEKKTQMRVDEISEDSLTEKERTKNVNKQAKVLTRKKRCDSGLFV